LAPEKEESQKKNGKDKSNMEIMTIVILACGGVLLQCAEPIILIKRALGFKEEEYDNYSKEKRFFHRLIYCAMCLTFWVGLALTWNLGISIVGSVLAAYIYKKINE
jgi:hypothetical protein